MMTRVGPRSLGRSFLSVTTHLQPDTFRDMSTAKNLFLIAMFLGCGGEDDDTPTDREQAIGGAYCGPVDAWPQSFVNFEREVFELVNEARAVGHDCDTEGNFGPADPLTQNPYLRCAARNQSVDMHDREFFAHVNPDGDGPSDRVDQTGYDWSFVGENIAYGYPTPEEVMEGWLESDGHCANIMFPEFTEIGVGYFFDDGNGDGGAYWAQVFGTPF